MLQPRVHTYRAAETGLFVNSYLIEGDEGVLVVDTNLLVSDIEALRARLGALKKPLTGVVVTHAHPDHFNGVFGLVKDREVPVYAAHSVARVIQEIAEAKRAQWSPIYGEEWPAETYHPNTLVADCEPIPFEAMTVSLHDVGPAETPTVTCCWGSPAGTPWRSSGTSPSTAPTRSPPTGTRARGWPPLISLPIGWPKSRSSSPATAIRRGRKCSPTSAATSSTTGRWSVAWPRASRSSSRQPNKNSTVLCRRTCPAPRSPGWSASAPTRWPPSSPLTPG